MLNLDQLTDAELIDALTNYMKGIEEDDNPMVPLELNADNTLDREKTLRLDVYENFNKS